MWNQIKAQRYKAILLIFISVLSFISIINIPPSYEEQADMINNMPALVKLELNLKALLMYNQADSSIIQDVKNLFTRDWNSKIYRMHKLNILSLLVMVILPIIMIIVSLAVLKTSFNAILLIITIFFCFALLPIFVL